MARMGTLRVLKLLVLTVVMLALASVFAYAKTTNEQAVFLTQWTPATVVTVLSVAFSFGVCYQTIVVQGKILKKLETWKEENVDPCLDELKSDVRLLQRDCGQMGSILGLSSGGRGGGWNGPERRKNPR